MIKQQSTDQREKSPFRTVELEGGHQIVVAHASYFDHYATHRVDCLFGQYYEFALLRAESRCVLLIKNRATQALGQVNREDAARRRLELAAGLHAMLDAYVALEPGAIDHSLPLALLTHLYQEASSDHAVPGLFFRNTRRCIEAEVTAQPNVTAGARASKADSASRNDGHSLQSAPQHIENRNIARPVFSEVLQARSTVMQSRKAKIKMRQP